MEARCDVMTDKQFEGVIRMILTIVEAHPTREEAIKAIKNLLEPQKDSDRNDRKAG
ncbi:MAG: hypothetical protein FWG71_07140 [Synergistaceae bacterium]|nr:hypothetical protein [Synergistaceae bacterium]